MKSSVLALLLIFGCAAPAKAADQKYHATYDVYAGGIHALQARLDIDKKSGKYEINVASETYGLLGRIVPWHAKFYTQGWREAKGRQPKLHVSDTTTRKKHEVNTYKYSQKGDFLSFRQVVNGRDETRADLDPSIMKGTTDILSAVFNLVDRVAAGEGCAFEDMIFDSERSYRVTFRDRPGEMLMKNKYSSFSGAADACSAEVTPEGGEWHKKPRGWLKIQEQSKKQKALPTLYFARISDAQNAPFVPVRVVIKTDYGVFIAHLTSFQDKSIK